MNAMNPFACMAPRAGAPVLNSSQKCHVFLRFSPPHIICDFLASSAPSRHTFATLKTTPHWLEECSRASNQEPGNLGTENSYRGDVDIASLGDRQEQPIESTTPLPRHALQTTRASNSFDRSITPEGIIRSRHNELIKHVLRLKTRRRYR